MPHSSLEILFMWIFHWGYTVHFLSNEYGIMLILWHLFKWDYCWCTYVSSSIWFFCISPGSAIVLGEADPRSRDGFRIELNFQIQLDFLLVFVVLFVLKTFLSCRFHSFHMQFTLLVLFISALIIINIKLYHVICFLSVSPDTHVPEWTSSLRLSIFDQILNARTIHYTDTLTE